MHLIKKALQGYDIPHILPPTLLTNIPMGSTFNPVMNPGIMGPAFSVSPNPNILYNAATLPFPGASAASELNLCFLLPNFLLSILMFCFSCVC